MKAAITVLMAVVVLHGCVAPSKKPSTDQIANVRNISIVAMETPPLISPYEIPVGVVGVLPAVGDKCAMAFEDDNDTMVGGEPDRAGSALGMVPFRLVGQPTEFPRMRCQDPRSGDSVQRFDVRGQRI